MLYNEPVTILTLMLFLDPWRVAVPVPTATSSAPGCFAKLDELKRIDFGGHREPTAEPFDPQKVPDLLPVTF